MNVKTEKPMTVVLGVKDGKHHALVYSPELHDKALAAAVHWGLQIGIAESTEAILAARKLPNGSIFPHEKMKPAVITPETYDAMLKVISLKTPHEGQAAKRVGGPAAKTKGTTKSQEDAKTLWSEITIGSTVLAFDRESGGYFSARVEKASADQLTCTWIGFPKLPHFSVRRLAVGLLPVVK